VVEYLMLSSIKNHTFEPTKVRNDFTEEELTLGKNRLLEVDSLVEWE